MTSGTFKFSSVAKLATVAVLVSSSSWAFAASTWSVDSCGTDNNASTTNPVIGSSTMSGYLQSTGAGCTQGTNVGSNSVHAYAYAVNNSSTSNTFATANLLQHGVGYGLGVQSGTESPTPAPEHTMDNNVYTELIAFKFDSAVILDKITLGWTQGDADFSLFAWKGASAPTTTDITTKTAVTLNSASGWSLVGNYANAGGTTSPNTTGNDRVSTVNAGSVSSSWWIVSAYNSNYGGSVLDITADYMKIMTIASKDGTTTPPGGNVPEPGSLALMGIAIAGVVAVRRRKQSDV